MKWLFAVVFTLVLSVLATRFAFAENHNHDEHKEEESHDDAEEHGHDEGAEEKHGHAKGEESHEEESSGVGPDKGVTAKSEKGIQLAPEAVTTFDLKTVDFANVAIRISKDAIVQIKDEKTIFRLRDGWYKRIPFKLIRSEEEHMLIESSGLHVGDKIVVQATGFLRMAEVAASGGASHGHSH